MVETERAEAKMLAHIKQRKNRTKQSQREKKEQQQAQQREA